MMKRKYISLVLAAAVTLMLTACGQNVSIQPEEEVFKDWAAVEKAGRGKTVTIQMWGGNDHINQYMDTTIAKQLKEQYDITLKRVPMNPPEYLSRLMNEKSVGLDSGTADVLWINAENFKTARQGGLLWGPYDELLPNLNTVYDRQAGDLKTDTGVPIEGMEAIWGRAQLVLTTDSARVSEAPRSYAELLLWAQAHPGRFTYPKLPDDFAGSAFVRGALYEMAKDIDFSEEMTQEEFSQAAAPAIEYFKALKPHLWREGTAYPVSQAQQDELFRNNEVDFTIGFELGKTAGQVKEGVYPKTAYAYVFDTGTIGNAHYLAVPFNAPEKAAALLTINVLESPKNQLEKFKPEVWGDMPAFDPSRLTAQEQADLKKIEAQVFSMPLEALNQKRLPELNAQYIEWMEMLWVEAMSQ